MTPDIVFIDIETTGLDPDRHQLWELAAVHLDGRIVYGRWQVGLDGAQGGALAVGSYYARSAGMPRHHVRRADVHGYPQRVLTGLDDAVWLSPRQHGESTAWADLVDGETKRSDERDDKVVARTLATLTSGATIAGAAPHFDTQFLSRWLDAHGCPAAWSHRLLDVCTYAAGAWGLPGPRSLSATLEDAAIDHDSRAHTAMYDALQARRLWTQIAAESGVIADWPAHDVVAERAEQHVKAWEHGLPLGPESIGIPHDDPEPERSATPLTDRLSPLGDPA